MLVSLFGNSRVAAIGLRGRVLERLGDEPEWTEGDYDDDFICWTAGPAATFSCVVDGPDGVPDLQVAGRRDTALTCRLSHGHPLPR